MNILFYGTPEDRSYLHYLKPHVGTHRCYILTSPISTLYEIESYCAARDITHVLTTSPKLLEKISDRHRPKISNFAGSWFKKGSLEYVVLEPLKQWSLPHRGHQKPCLEPYEDTNLLGTHLKIFQPNLC